MQPLEFGRGNLKIKYKPERLEYLDQLVTEFKTTKSKDAREQVLANLANFAYDPLNHDYFQQLNILDLFMDNLSSQEENLIKFSIGGLCNLCLEPSNKDHIKKKGLIRIIRLLNHNNEDIILSAITTLIFLITSDSKSEITSTEVIKSMLRIPKEKSARLKNLITIFLEDYCAEEQVKLASSAECESVEIFCQSLTESCKKL